MNCTQCREILGMGHRKSASTDEHSALQAHLTQCPACAHEAAQLEQLFTLLDHQEQPSPALAAGFAIRLRQWVSNNAGADTPSAAQTIATPHEQPTTAQTTTTLHEQSASAKSAPVRTMPTFSLGGLFRVLWPTRPLGAFSYSTALLFMGLLGGQLLPPGALGVSGPEAAQETKTTNGVLICPVQYSPTESPYSPANLLS